MNENHWSASGSLSWLLDGMLKNLGQILPCLSYMPCVWKNFHIGSLALAAESSCIKNKCKVKTIWPLLWQKTKLEKRDLIAQ